MARITWLGDAECIWNDVTFPAGVPVETDDPYMIGKARNSPFFKVEMDVSFFDDPPATQWREPETEADYSPECVVDPSPKRKRGRPPKVRNHAD